MHQYFIKNGYRCNLDQGGKAHQYEDCESNSSIYQVDTYKYAARIAKTNRVRNVLDVGCGYGTKLVKYIYPHCRQITDIDQHHSISWCRTNHPVGQWIEDDIESDAPNVTGIFDLIISSDVVEHLATPYSLMNYIKMHSSSETLIVISTPERDKTRGKYSLGPHPNVTHVREWNKDEFNSYVSSREFEILEYLLVRDYLRPIPDRIKDMLLMYDSKKCQLVLCKLATMAK